jgi:hypothetical protein
MKLLLPAIVVILFHPLSGASLSTSLSHSVCAHKKTSLTGWLALLQSHLLSPQPLLLSATAHFLVRLTHFSCTFKLQVASHPA